MMSESDKWIPSKDVPSVASMTDVLFPEKVKFQRYTSTIYVNISISIGWKFCVSAHH